MLLLRRNEDGEGRGGNAGEICNKGAEIRERAGNDGAAEGEGATAKDAQDCEAPREEGGKIDSPSLGRSAPSPPLH